MISVSRAYELVMTHSHGFGEESIDLFQSKGRFLAEEIIADRDLPPFDRVTMDGIAIDYSSIKKGQRNFIVQEIAAAGMPLRTLTNPDQCIEVMTGAILPQGSDTVIRYEDIDIANGSAYINVEVSQGQNIHLLGSDRIAGARILSQGRRITAAEIGVCATFGYSSILVKKLPRMLIVSTGDELVEITADPLPHQIRKSNVYQLQAIVEAYGIHPELLHLEDNYDVIRDSLRDAISKFDVIVLSGAVSKGKYDHVPGVLDELGVSRYFHRVSQRPGKPFWFGSQPDGPVIFALPGNPVSTFLCAHRYILPWLEKSFGAETINKEYVILAEDMTFSPPLTWFPEVKIVCLSDGRMEATPVSANGSGDLAKLIDADGFIELPAENDLFRKGEVYPFFRYR